ncbi:hypothetical protein [Mycolicibacterium sp. HK-90]|uniref:hypothetical protein n=1 Tax=Mycolicibacterium sp. HK-90 TaxID=3056937 RepID=UPI00265B4189|nr:hypothetical protein [Mycolicibacterium sp. HK-90]WKG03418.1 hypothetical protein QU592_30315 [Mycolicibacterium sp. HK-90]
MKNDKGGGTVTYRMHVVATDAAELAVNAGGLIVDRMMSGWRVTVELLDDTDSRPVRILGAELVDAVTPPDRPDEEQCVLVMGAEAHARVVSGEGMPAGCVEALVWGESPDPHHIYGHTLSAAARAFKAQAVAAAQLAVAEVATAETFTSMNAKTFGISLRA